MAQLADFDMHLENDRSKCAVMIDGKEVRGLREVTVSFDAAFAEPPQVVLTFGAASVAVGGSGEVMSPEEQEERSLASVRSSFFGIKQTLRQMVESACPGRLHLPVAHNDSREKWCPDCGRNDLGQMLGTPNQGVDNG